MKTRKLLVLIMTIALALSLFACGASGNVKPPFSEVALGSSESDVTNAYGESEKVDELDNGGKKYSYPCTYLGVDGKVSFSIGTDGKVYRINWSYSAKSDDEFNTLVDTFKADYTKQYGDPSYENDVGTIWSGKGYTVSAETVSMMNIHRILISFLQGDSKSGSSTSSDSNTETSVESEADPLVATAVYKKGESFEGDGYKLSIDSVDATPIFDGYADADSGTEYFFAGFELENTSNADLDVNSFFTVVADGEECSFINFYDKYNDIDAITWNTSVAAGRKIKNYFSAVVPEKWNEIQILCSDGSAVSIKHTDLGSISADENSSESTIYYLGDTMTRNGMKITLTGARQTEYVSKDSYTYYEPADGKVFVILFFDIKNTSDQTQRFNALNTFDVFIDDYSDRFTSFLYTTVDDMEDLNDQDYKDILSGKSMSGYKVIEAPANWKKIELATRQGAFLIESKDFV